MSVKVRALKAFQEFLLKNDRQNIKDLLTSVGGRNTVTDVVFGKLKNIIPASENLIKTNISRDLYEIIKRTQKGGQSYNPRTGRFIRTLYDTSIPVSAQDAGYIMAPAKELSGARVSFDINNKDAVIAQAVKEMANDPRVLKRLRRGELLGTWVDNNEVITDPSRQYLTKGGSLVAGRKSMQQAGFSPRYDQYDVFTHDPVTGKLVMTPEALNTIKRYRTSQLLSALGLPVGTLGYDEFSGDD